MDQQTIEITQALRRKVSHVSSQLETSPLAEFYDPSRERAKLKRTALAHNPANKPASSTTSKPSAAPAPAKDSTSAAEKASLARVMAANKEAEAKKAAKPEVSATKQKLLARIKNMINQSIDVIDVNALMEDMELYIAITDSTDPTHAEITEMIRDLSAALLNGFDLSEDLQAKCQKWVQG